MPTDAFFPLVFLSLSSIHILCIESLFLVLRSFGSSPFRKRRSRASLVVHGPAFCIVSKFFPRVSINAMAGCRLAAGFDLAIRPFRKNVESRTFFPKTTVPWLGGHYLVCDSDGEVHVLNAMIVYNIFVMILWGNVVEISVWIDQDSLVLSLRHFFFFLVYSASKHSPKRSFNISHCG